MNWFFLSQMALLVANLTLNLRLSRKVAQTHKSTSGILAQARAMTDQAEARLKGYEELVEWASESPEVPQHIRALAYELGGWRK
jgi:hypothetical protein